MTSYDDQLARRLVLVRHSKAEPAGPPDFDRVLAPRGIRDAAAVGAWLAGEQLVPDAVAVSPARRTRQTWELAAATLGTTAAPVFDERIYEAEVEDLLAVIHDTADDARVLAVVGHNPGLHELAFTLSDRAGDDALLVSLSRDFPTSAVAVFDVAASWHEVALEGCRLIALTAPRG